MKLVGSHEIRTMLGGVSKQRVYQITSRRDFPKPVAELTQGRVWRKSDVQRWITEHRPDLADQEGE